MNAIRDELNRLLKEFVPPRIRIRNGGGTFEVVLSSINEENQTVVVLWDGGMYKEFKWGAIMWGAR